MSYKDEVQLIQQPDLSEPDVPPKDKKFKGYYKISRHYNWALNTTFKYGYDFVIIVEGERVLICNTSCITNFTIIFPLQTISISRQISMNISSEHSRCCELIKRSGAYQRGMIMARRVSLTMSRLIFCTDPISSRAWVG